MTESDPMTRLILPAALASLSVLTIGNSTVSAMQAAAPASAGSASPYTYADLADLASIAPIVLHARIADSTVLKPERAPGLAAGSTRFYVEAEVIGLIRGSGPLAQRTS